ncbi:hypothetical protein LZ012_13085 [Dechloromonas sp. XY25]|uniref:Uncharacterized protein n=1 Tax=Dechloromonas hankyongensis TaxID=2908002 RepID=A0ABS9K417_9RHOO|nr:hypothetical protein [Dechloromonas hankyongensis]MCG2577924.1 hypothetical protein [Dechloromonas hankyongensis]
MDLTPRRAERKRLATLRLQAFCLPSDEAWHKTSGERVEKGRRQRYVNKQLNEWKRDECKNGAGGIMNQIARQLTESDIEQVSAYLLGQP